MLERGFVYCLTLTLSILLSLNRVVGSLHQPQSCCSVKSYRELSHCLRCIDDFTAKLHMATVNAVISCGGFVVVAVVAVAAAVIATSIVVVAGGGVVLGRVVGRLAVAAVSGFVDVVAVIAVSVVVGSNATSTRKTHMANDLLVK